MKHFMMEWGKNALAGLCGLTFLIAALAAPLVLMVLVRGALQSKAVIACLVVVGIVLFSTALGAWVRSERL